MDTETVQRDAQRHLSQDESLDELDSYVREIADEARGRGVTVEVLDAAEGYLALTLDDRRIVTRGAMSELTSAISLSYCDDKRMTHKLLSAAGIEVPRFRTATFDEGDLEFLHELGELVVKPARGEMGTGVTVGVLDREGLEAAIEEAREEYPVVMLEELCAGHDLRMIVIGHELVAAAVRHPAKITGNGRDTIAALIEARSRQRQDDTNGESRIPMNGHTRETVRRAGYGVDDVLPDGEQLAVRRTANLHTGGTITDVTDRLHPEYERVAVLASQVLEIPVVGLDLLVPSVESGEYVVIEANERPGLSNHEPQPTNERFIDLLFPSTRTRE